MAKPQIPLAQQFMSRDGTLGVVDSFVENGCFNKQGEKLYVFKRPGTTLSFDFGTGIDPQGATFYNALIYAVYADTLFRTGGTIFVGSDGVTWTQAATPSWQGRSFFTATVFNNLLYVIGGENAGGQFADISYTADCVLWSQSASGPPFGHRQGHAACAFNGSLWVMGGTGPTVSPGPTANDVWSSPDAVNWTQVTAAAKWTARENFSLVAANNGMYLYGGLLNDGTLGDDVWYSTDGNTWTQLTAAATGTGRQLATLLFFNNKLWIIGGCSDATATIDINDISSSVDGQVWTVTTPIFPVGRGLMAGVVYNNQMWLIAGQKGGVLDSDVLASPDGVTWTYVASAPGFTARGAAQAVVFPTPPTVNAFRYATMWLIGGNDGATDLQEVWYGNLDLPLASTYAFSPDRSNQPYQFNTFNAATQLLIKNQSNFWVLQSGSLTKVTDTNYPAVTVPGIVVLNQFAYAGTPEGAIRSCAINDPLHWPSLQSILANYEDDPLVAIAKYLNYLVAFGQYTIQFFYDAGNPAPGTALSPYQSTSVKIGMTFASTLQSSKNTLIWVGQTKERNPGVYVFDGLEPKRVSSKWVDKVINVNLNSAVKSWITGMEGHTFYVLQFLGTMALAYDLDTGEWGPWSSNVTSDGSVPYSIALTEFFSGGDIWFGRDAYAGQIFTASLEKYDDAGTAFNLRSQSDQSEDQLQRVFWGQANFFGDQVTGATATLEVSDDDYATWTTWGMFDLSLSRPLLNRGGSARRRAFRLTQTDANPARWVELKFNASGGES